MACGCSMVPLDEIVILVLGGDHLLIDQSLVTRDNNIQFRVSMPIHKIRYTKVLKRMMESYPS